MTDNEITNIIGQTTVINKEIKMVHPDGNVLNISTNSVILDDAVYGDYRSGDQGYSVLKDSEYGRWVRATLLHSHLTFSGLMGSN